jgi:hypothetical protein
MMRIKSYPVNPVDPVDNWFFEVPDSNELKRTHAAGVGLDFVVIVFFPQFAVGGCVGFRSCAR